MNASLLFPLSMAGATVLVILLFSPPFAFWDYLKEQHGRTDAWRFKFRGRFYPDPDPEPEIPIIEVDFEVLYFLIRQYDELIREYDALVCKEIPKSTLLRIDPRKNIECHMDFLTDRIFDEVAVPDLKKAPYFIQRRAQDQLRKALKPVLIEMQRLEDIKCLSKPSNS